MSFQPEHCRAARAILGWSQAELAEVCGVATKTIADFEREERTPFKRTLAEIERALQSVGIEFTNGGRPGVKTTPLWALHRLADRSSLEVRLRNAGREGFWKIVRTGSGLDCWNQHGEKMGTVQAGSVEKPQPRFDPDIGEICFADRTTPDELGLWIAEMLHRDSERMSDAHHRAPQTVAFPTDIGPSRSPA